MERPSLLRRLDEAAGAMNPALALLVLGLALVDVVALGARGRIAAGGPIAPARAHAPDETCRPAAGVPWPGWRTNADERD